MSDTPRTDSAEFDWNEDCNPENAMIVTADFARQLKRELADKTGILSEIFHWIERHHPDGFIDGETYTDQLDKIMGRYHEIRESLERDLAEASRRIVDLQGGKMIEEDRWQALYAERDQLAARVQELERCLAIEIGKEHQWRECARELLPFAIAYGSHPHRAEKDDLPKALAAFERLEKGEGK